MTAQLTRNTFRELVQRQVDNEEDVTADIIDRGYDVILRAYDGERQRHYHTMSHIQAMWEAWNYYCYSQSIGSCHSDDVVRLAIVFHECGLDRRLLLLILIRPHYYLA